MTGKADLFLLAPGFEDPAFPDAVWFDRYSTLLEGVLAAFPKLRASLTVHRVDFARPRRDVIALAGEGNQSLPRLVLPTGVASVHASDEHDGRWSAAGATAVIAVLVDLYGLPSPHP